MEDFQKAMLEASWKNLEAQEKRWSEIDNKALGITTVVGLLMAFMIRSKFAEAGLFFIVPLFFLLLSVLFSILTLVPRQVENLSTKILVEELKEERSEYQIPRLVATIAEVEDSLCNVCNVKAKWLACSTICLGIGVLSMVLYLIFSALL